jgi:hypothetical protein
MSSDPLREFRSRKRAAKREQPEPEPEPSVRTPLVRRQGPSSMPPRARGSRKTIDDVIRDAAYEFRERPRGWRRI